MFIFVNMCAHKFSIQRKYDAFICAFNCLNTTNTVKYYLYSVPRCSICHVGKTSDYEYFIGKMPPDSLLWIVV